LAVHKTETLTKKTAWKETNFNHLFMGVPFQAKMNTA